MPKALALRDRIRVCFTPAATAATLPFHRTRCPATPFLPDALWRKVREVLDAS